MGPKFKAMLVLLMLVKLVLLEITEVVTVKELLWSFVCNPIHIVFSVCYLAG